MKKHRSFPRCSFAVLCCLALLLVGCSHTPKTEGYGSLNISIPQVPLFLNGSMAALLTNRLSYTARVTSQANATTTGFGPETVSGQFLAADGKLLFAPDEKKPKSKTSKGPGILFVWDVNQHSGFIQSETMQGYAPISSGLTFTNVAVRNSALAPGKIEGHVCTPQEVTVSSSEGVVSSFTVWRDQDSGVPALIESSGGSAAGSRLTLSKVKPEQIAADLFQPPNEFTRYQSVESMMTELALREQNLRRRLPNEGWYHTAEPPAAYPNPGQPR